MKVRVLNKGFAKRKLHFQPKLPWETVTVGIPEPSKSGLMVQEILHDRVMVSSGGQIFNLTIPRSKTRLETPN